VFVGLFSSSDSDPDDVDEAEEDDEAARLFLFRLRFLAGAFATAGDIVEVDDQGKFSYVNLRIGLGL
jgi:hypothetical protein